MKNKPQDEHLVVKYHPKRGMLKHIPKPTRGGAREGAGRKQREAPREAITVRLEPQDAAKLRDLCKARSVSQAEWVTDKIRRSRL